MKFWIFDASGQLCACFIEFDRAQIALKNNSGYTLVVAKTRKEAMEYIQCAATMPLTNLVTICFFEESE
jgi:hypothetical protein